jgi:hypothetical protein
VEADDEDVLVGIDPRTAHGGRDHVASLPADDDELIGRVLTVGLGEGNRVGAQLPDLGRGGTGGQDERPCRSEEQRSQRAHAIFSSGA